MCFQIKILTLSLFALLFCDSSSHAQFVPSQLIYDEPCASNVFFLNACDVDADGDIDLVQDRGWLRQEDDGSYTVQCTWDASYTFAEMISGDVDLDGDVDLIARNMESVFLLRNDGVGNFNIELCSQTGNWIRTLCDVDSDGDPDLFLFGPNPDTQQLQNFWLENEMGTFGQPNWLHTGAYADLLECGDLDQDGDQDFAYGWQDGPSAL